MAARSKMLGFLGATVQRVGKELPPGELAAINGAPKEVLQRAVTIFAPARTPMSQGLAKTPGAGKQPCWRISFDTQAKWENPLIGWTSTADPLENVARSALAFETKEEAIAFCAKNGYKYEVREPAPEFLGRPKRYMGYGDNFSVKRKGIPMGGLLSELIGDVKAAAPEAAPEAAAAKPAKGKGSRGKAAKA